MSYCRFENTHDDLQDCADHIHDADLSKSEKRYRDRLVDLCREIAEEADQEEEQNDDQN
jgi:plasmid stabilization system protein ParE